jgi:hypothetical protein
MKRKKKRRKKKKQLPGEQVKILVPLVSSSCMCFVGNC